MQIQNYEFKSEFAKRYIAEGKAEGFAEGASEGPRHTLVAICQARGLLLDDAMRARIAACEDPALLERWVVRAATAAAIADVFAE